jgi:hypothetical protein
MRRAFGVGVVLLLALGIFNGPAAGQQTGPPSRDRIRLEQNYPNPFNPVTRIPFFLDAELFARGGPVVVSVTIFNVLAQPVAIPTALRHPRGDGAEVRNLEYHSPGLHEVYWDGTDRNGDKVASGLYYVQLVVNGQRAAKTIRMVVAK